MPLLAKTPSIAEIVEHPSTLELLDQLLPKNFLLSAALSILVHPGETPAALSTTTTALLACQCSNRARASA
jgi:hypothetical protein